MRNIALLILAVLVVGLAGCDPAATNAPVNGPASDGKLQVVVTTAMVADLVSHVAGDRAVVTSLMGEGIDPHLFRATFSDLEKLQQADVVFYSGLTLEGQMQAALEKVQKTGKVVAAVTKDLPHEKLRNPPEFAGHPDPHVWHDVALWASCLDAVVEVLSQQQPDHAAEFRANADAYRTELLAVDQYARERITTIPADKRYLVTAHDAFAYFSKTYGIEEKSAQGITTESEAGLADINQLIDFLVEKQVPAIFMEVTVNSKALDAVVQGAGKRGWQVRQGGVLYSDSMGQPGTYEGTYIGMIDHNVTTIARALGGEAPERGMAGKLAQ